MLTKTIGDGRGCEFTTEDKFVCADLKIFSDVKSNRLEFQLLQIDVDETQQEEMYGADDIRIQSISISLIYRSTQFIVCFDFIKYIFVVCALVCLYKFNKTLK